MPAAIRFLTRDPECHTDVLLAAGHVCSITGIDEYRKLARQTRRPIAVTGFEPADLLYGIYRVIQLHTRGEARVVNAYARAVPPQGNEKARRETADSSLPATPVGGGWVPFRQRLKLRPAYEQYEARNRFHCAGKPPDDTTSCRAGEIMKGEDFAPRMPPLRPPLHSDSPMGPSMVSAEGACAAFYRYRTT